MCEAVLHSHTGLRVSTNFQRWQFPHQIDVFKETWLFSHLASRDARRRALRVGTTQEEFFFDIQQQVLLPALSTFHYHILVMTYIPNSRATGDHERRANETAQHDETSRARRQDPRTVTAKAQRTALSSTTSAPVLLQTDDFRTRIDDFEIPLLLLFYSFLYTRKIRILALRFFLDS